MDQIGRGADFLTENPLGTEARKEPPIQRLERREDTHVAISHMCHFNLTSVDTGLLLKTRNIIFWREIQNLRSVSFTSCFICFEGVGQGSVGGPAVTFRGFRQVSGICEGPVAQKI